MKRDIRKRKRLPSAADMNHVIERAWKSFISILPNPYREYDSATIDHNRISVMYRFAGESLGDFYLHTLRVVDSIKDSYTSPDASFKDEERLCNDTFVFLLTFQENASNQGLILDKDAYLNDPIKVMYFQDLTGRKPIFHVPPIDFENKVSRHIHETPDMTAIVKLFGMNDYNHLLFPGNYERKTLLTVRAEHVAEMNQHIRHIVSRKNRFWNPFSDVSFSDIADVISLNKMIEDGRPNEIGRYRITPLMEMVTELWKEDTERIFTGIYHLMFVPLHPDDPNIDYMKQYVNRIRYMLAYGNKEEISLINSGISWMHRYKWNKYSVGDVTALYEILKASDTKKIFAGLYKDEWIPSIYPEFADAVYRNLLPLSFIDSRTFVLSDAIDGFSNLMYYKSLIKSKHG